MAPSVDKRLSAWMKSTDTYVTFCRVPLNCDGHVSIPTAGCVLRHVRTEWALLSFHSVCLSVCLSVIPRPTVYHNWSITTKFGRQVYTCPRTRVNLFGSALSHTFGARGKNMQNFAYFQRVFLPLRTWRIVPYDLSLCLSVCLSVCLFVCPLFVFV